MNTLPMQKPCINHLSIQEPLWFAVYTRYKCEKYVFNHLIKKGVECYLPLINKTKKYNRKIKTHEIPLINCYIFVKVKKDQYLTVLETEYVIKFLKSGNELLSIPQEEIDILRRVVGDIDDIYMMQSDKYIFEGQEVEVSSGHLIGMRGKVIHRQGKHSFLVNLESMGFQLEIAINAKLLQPCNPILVR